jgi:hypothetical protein
MQIPLLIKVQCQVQCSLFWFGLPLREESLIKITETRDNANMYVILVSTICIFVLTQTIAGVHSSMQERKFVTIQVTSMLKNLCVCVSVHFWDIEKFSL